MTAKKTKEEKLRRDALKASRIDQVLKASGWKDIQEIIQNKYDDAMNELIAKENPEARGAINAIQDIMNDISVDLQFGENARKKYNEQYFNIKKPE